MKLNISKTYPQKKRGAGEFFHSIEEYFKGKN
jgi:hypothetical protein